MPGKKGAVGAAVGKRAARGAGKAALKGGKAQAKLAANAASSKQSAKGRLLKYGLVAVAGFAVGALVSRSGRDEGDASSFTGTTGLDTPSPGSVAERIGETFGSGTSSGGSTGGATDIGTTPQQHQQPQDQNRTGSERGYSDPSSGPLVGSTHRDQIGEMPVQNQEVEQRIRTRVGEDRRTSDVPHLNVEVNGDVADIRGQVHSDEEKQAIEEIARETEGVNEVRNLLTVNPNAPRRRDGGTDGDHSNML